MNILVNEKNNILQTSSALSPGINLKLEALFSYIYCKTIKTINLDRNEYSTYFLKKGFSEETLKAQLSAFIDFVRENCKEIYDTLKKENDAYDFNEVLSVYSKCLKENPSKFFGIIALCAQKELEENFTQTNPIKDLIFSKKIQNLKETFLLSNTEILFFILTAFNKIEPWLFRNDLDTSYRVKIFNELSDVQKLSESDLEKINKKFLHLGFFESDWTISDFVFSVLTENCNPFLERIKPNPYADYYNVDAISTENVKDLLALDKILSICNEQEKGCYISVCNSSAFRVKNFVSDFCSDKKSFVYEIKTPTQKISKKEFFFLLVTISGELKEKNGILFIQNDLLTQLFSEEKSSNKVHFVLNSEKENSQCFDFNQDEILNFIQVPTFISVQNQDENTFSLLEEKFKLVYKWELQNPTEKEYKKQFTNFLIQKNSKTQYICEISNLCEELKVEPENWEKVANLSKLSEDFSEVEIFSIIESNFSNKIDESTLRQNTFFEPKAINSTEPIEKVQKILENAKKWQKQNFNQDSGIRILLYGPSGTGKTAYVETIAKKFNLKLIIVRASDILNSYVGETEQNIKKVFEQAKNENAILLIDEADSFLHARGNSVNRHEDRKVNEFLVQMERFPGILFCNTNMKEALDSATNRRFNLQIGFNPLKKEGVELLCKKYFEDFEFSESQINQIFDSGEITGGDFNALFGKLRFTDPEEIDSETIKTELINIVKNKKSSFGNTNKIGFFA